jgi:hydrogenase-4 component B
MGGMDTAASSAPALTLLLAAWAVPLALSLLWCTRFTRGVGVALAPWGAVPALALAIWALTRADLAEGEVLFAALPFLFTGVHLSLDLTGTIFLLFTSILWVAGGVFSARYHADDERRHPFFVLFLLTMAGNLGLVVAGDLLGFYLFFALMTFAAYGLVVHDRSEAALRAGRIYIILAILGELALLTGLLSLGVAADGVPLFGSQMEGVWATLHEGHPTAFPTLVTGTLLALGLGVKAGLVPLHLWLPLAHPVAPTAASALLSGAMIKAGLLGWIRVLPAETSLPLLAGGFLVLGVFGAFYGVVCGVAQDDPKTVLAYSSVSQMGYMAMGTGLLLHEPELAPLALAAIGTYALHHGLAKGALFLSVGLADKVPGRPASQRTAEPEVDSDRADEDPSVQEAAPAPDRRGTWILTATALPALALAGLPLTTGSLAKNTLKDGLAELGGAAYSILDPLLLVAAFGTTLLLARFLSTLARRRREALTNQKAKSLATAGENGAYQGGTRGLVLPWILLVGIGTTGAIWIPTLLPSPEGVPLPGALDGWLVGLLPVLLGALVGWGLSVRPNVLGSLRTIRIPAGDALIPVERGLAWLPLPKQEALVTRTEEWAALRWAQLAPVTRMADRWARGDIRSMEGVFLGSLVLGLALALVALLLVP